jgi:segregation and condensation protein A
MAIMADEEDIVSWDAPLPEGGVLAAGGQAFDEALIIDVDGYEGPLDLLLSLSRRQKVDLMRISVLQLAEQYLIFVERARALRLELAADYLVMAAWLAYLKSRLLLPPDPSDDGPSAQDLAAHLAYQLERLSAMREAGARLMARDQKGRDFFARGAPETVTRLAHKRYDTTLLDLMRAYARIKTRDEFRPYAFDRIDVFTMEEALDRLRAMIGFGGDWADLTSYLPKGWDASPTRRRAALAAHFAAVLEMAKQGQVSLRQAQVFDPIHIKAKPAP